MKERTLDLETLAKLSGVTARTIRFYIAQGLLDGPDRTGRNARYSGAHLDKLEKIRKLQAEGLMLAEIAARLEAARQPDLPPPMSCLKFSVSADVTVLVQASAGPRRMREIRAALEDLAARLRRPQED